MRIVLRKLALAPLVGEGLSSGGLLPPLLPCLRLHRVACRGLYSETGEWQRDYRAETRKQVEQRWHPRIKEQWKKRSAHEEEEVGGKAMSAHWPLVRSPCCK